MRVSDSESIEWAKNVKKRDNYICQTCRRYGLPLNSHHFNSWDFFEAQRYDLNNGICLCQPCHEMFHSIYGKGNNTYYQFQQFKKSMTAFLEELKKSSELK